ncbi:MAG: hypothetical protein N3B13_00740 [Deltaproteobacteria bacterium]|nr:hypothetical protein [Deltaproteobacteria bacterium]
MQIRSKNTDQCCSAGCNCNIDTDNNEICRYCKSAGIYVGYPVLKRFIKQEWQRDIKKDDFFYLCSNPDCNITYFSNRKSLYFTTDDIKIPIWFKRGASPKIICYCHRITEDMIREQVIKNNLTSFREIVLKYRKRIVCNCDRMNPAGQCCTKYFYSVINETLKSLGKPEVEIPENCC